MNVASLLSDLPAGSRILVIRLRSIGDIILLTPTLRLLNNWRSDLRVSVAVEHRFRSLLEGNPTIEEVLALALQPVACDVRRRPTPPSRRAGWDAPPV